MTIEAKDIPAQHQEKMPASEAEMTPAPEYQPRFPGSGRLEGKVALVTGGDSGIGRATSVLFAREGAKVAIVYLDEHDDAGKTKDEVEKEGSRALLLPGNQRDRDFCFEAVRQTVERFGKLDVLVNNAAFQMEQDDIRDISEEQLRKTFETNVYGPVFFIQAALDHLQPGSAIINTTSVNAYKGNDHLIDYSLTRGATQNLTRSMATALTEKGIRVNGVAPGPIWTPFIPGSMDADKVKGFGGQVPMNRPGQPNEVAPCFLFLACDDSSYMSGQVLHPNGGVVVGG